MINSSEISQLIHDPSKISAGHIEELDSLCDKHPYSQLFSILLLKGIANEGDISFDEQLLKHSYKIADRVKLYELINSLPTQKETEVETVLSNESVSTESEETPEVVVAQEEIVKETAEENSVVEEQPILETEMAPEEQEEVTEEVASIEPADAVEESILHHAYAAGYELDALTPEEEEALEQREIEKEQSPKETKASEYAEPISFTGWLKADSNYEEQSSEDKDAINAVVNSFEDFDPLSDLTGEVEKPKAEFFSPTKKAKESLKEDTLPVSETLAKIYYLQGNYPKAIEAYEQLSLKFPEKKIFFANQIRDLKKKLNT